METTNFKAWITSEGKELPFAFNQEHYAIVDAENGDIDFLIVKGWIRIACYMGTIAIQINEPSEESIYRVSKFLRLRKLTDLKIYIEVLSEKHTYELNQFSELEMMTKITA